MDEFYVLAVNRVSKNQFSRVQTQTRESVGLVAFIPYIAYQSVAQVVQVYSDLVGATGLRMHF